MQNLPFNLPLSEYQSVSPTDTTTPCQQIPIYYIHSVEQPFCRDFSCACHQNQRQVAALLASVYAGHMTLREAAALADKADA